MDYIVHGVAKSQTRLSDFHFQAAGNYTVLDFHGEKRVFKGMKTA